MIDEKLLKKIESGREYRKTNEFTVKMEENTDDMIVRGYATTFNEAYRLFSDGDVDVYEQVDPAAFDETDMSDVIMQYDHQGRVFARLSNNTLALLKDEHGLSVEANLGGTEIGRQLYEEIKGGYTNKMSFGFTVESDDYKKEECEGRTVITRTILRIGKLYDVSAVSLPANDGTEISARSLCDGVIAEAKQELLDREKRERQAQKIRILCEVNL